MHQSFIKSVVSYDRRTTATSTPIHSNRNMAHRSLISDKEQIEKFPDRIKTPKLQDLINKLLAIHPIITTYNGF